MKDGSVCYSEKRIFEVKSAGKGGKGRPWRAWENEKRTPLEK